MSKLYVYRVFGERPDGNYLDEYIEATSPQNAVDIVREKHGGEDGGVQVFEVSKVLSPLGWK